MKTETIDLTPTWAAVAPIIAHTAPHNPKMMDELLKMARLADRANQLIRALKVITLTPSIRIWLSENDPKALEQAERALDL